MFAKVGASNYSLTEEKCKQFVLEIVKALNFIHERQIVHLDLKPQNIMMRSRRDEFKIKLIGKIECSKTYFIKNISVSASFQ